MPVYMLIDIEIMDQEKYFSYVKAARPMVEAAGGKYLAQGGEITPISGGWNPERIVIISFESLEKMKRCFESEQYKKISPLRMESTRSRVVVVEGAAGAGQGPDKNV